METKNVEMCQNDKVFSYFGVALPATVNTSSGRHTKLGFGILRSLCLITLQDAASAVLWGWSGPESSGTSSPHT